MENAIQPTTALPIDGTQDLSGQVLGDFRVLRRLGQGGMGQVFLAEQVSLKRPVALKIMRPDLATDATALRRFQLEAEAVAKITHGNIVQVYAYGVINGLHYMALEYVEGKNLREYLAKKGTPELLIAVSIMRQVAAALQRASETGIVHRDIKPENILLTRKGEVKVTDFGLSRCLAGRESATAHLTQTGVAMGTPLYMSPEQVQGKDTDPRSDIYSFGVTCYHMLAGQPPYRGQSAIEVAIQHVQNAPPPLVEIRPDLPAELCQMVHKMMAKAPAERYQTARDLLKDLVRLREGLGLQKTQAALPFTQISAPLTTTLSGPDVPRPPVLARPRWNWRRLGLVAAVLLSLGLAGAGGAMLRQRSSRPATSATLATETKLVRAAPEPEPRAHNAAKAVELVALYLEQRRFDDAEQLCRQLIEEPNRFTGPARFTRSIGHILQAVLLAFRDEALKSNQRFLEMEKRGPKSPEHQLFLRMPKLRRLVSEALTRNAANIAPEPLPEPLERLRQIPLPRSAEKAK